MPLKRIDSLHRNGDQKHSVRTMSFFRNWGVTYIDRIRVSNSKGRLGRDGSVNTTMYSEIQILGEISMMSQTKYLLDIAWRLLRHSKVFERLVNRWTIFLQILSHFLEHTPEIWLPKDAQRIYRTCSLTNQSSRRGHNRREGERAKLAHEENYFRNQLDISVLTVKG